MYAERRGNPKRRAEFALRQPLLVQSVPSLVQRAEERLQRPIRVISRQDAAVARAVAGAEWMRGRVQAAGIEVEADRLRDGVLHGLLSSARKLAFCEIVLWLGHPLRDRFHERIQLANEIGK